MRMRFVAITALVLIVAVVLVRSFEPEGSRDGVLIRYEYHLQALVVLLRDQLPWALEQVETAEAPSPAQLYQARTLAQGLSYHAIVLEQTVNHVEVDGHIDLANHLLDVEHNLARLEQEERRLSRRLTEDERLRLASDRRRAHQMGDALARYLEASALSLEDSESQFQLLGYWQQVLAQPDDVPNLPTVKRSLRERPAPEKLAVDLGKMRAISCDLLPNQIRLIELDNGRSESGVTTALQLTSSLKSIIADWGSELSALEATFYLEIYWSLSDLESTLLDLQHRRRTGDLGLAATDLDVMHASLRSLSSVPNIWASLDANPALTSSQRFVEILKRWSEWSPMNIPNAVYSAPMRC